MRAAWKAIIFMTLLLVISLSLISYVSKVSGNVEENSLAYKVMNIENKIDDVISDTYRNIHNTIAGRKWKEEL